MSKPAEQILINQVADWLREISIVNGYTGNAGLDVRTEEWRDAAETVTGTVLTVIDADADALELRRWRVEITIEIIQPLTTSGRAVARQTLADVARALNRNISTWRDIGAGVTGVQTVSKRVDRSVEGSDYQTAAYTIAVTYGDLTPKPPAAA